MTCTCCCSPVPVDPGIFQKVLPTIVGSGIVITLFIIGRFLDSTIRLREVRRNWYLKVIIDPNISKLEDFYVAVLDTVKESIEALAQLKVTTIFDDYIVGKSIHMGRFQVLKRKFEIEFIALVQTNYPEISNELESLLRNLEDKVTACLDKDDLNTTHYQALEHDVSATKYELLRVLYKPLALKRFHLFKNTKS